MGGMAERGSPMGAAGGGGRAGRLVSDMAEGSGAIRAGASPAFVVVPVVLSTAGRWMAEVCGTCGASCTWRRHPGEAKGGGGDGKCKGQPAIQQQKNS